jgi:hypothetical protein
MSRGGGSRRPGLEGRSLLFKFSESDDCDDTEDVAEGICIVGLHDDRPKNIQLLGADKDLMPPDEAAERFQLDAEGLRAAALAAGATPRSG